MVKKIPDYQKLQATLQKGVWTKIQIEKPDAPGHYCTTKYKIFFNDPLALDDVWRVFEKAKIAFNGSKRFDPVLNGFQITVTQIHAFEKWLGEMELALGKEYRFPFKLEQFDIPSNMYSSNAPRQPVQRDFLEGILSTKSSHAVPKKPNRKKPEGATERDPDSLPDWPARITKASANKGQKATLT